MAALICNNARRLSKDPHDKLRRSSPGSALTISSTLRRQQASFRAAETFSSTIVWRVQEELLWICVWVVCSWKPVKFSKPAECNYSSVQFFTRSQQKPEKKENQWNPEQKVSWTCCWYKFISWWIPNSRGKKQNLRVLTTSQRGLNLQK